MNAPPDSANEPSAKTPFHQTHSYFIMTRENDFIKSGLRWVNCECTYNRALAKVLNDKEILSKEEGYCATRWRWSYWFYFIFSLSFVPLKYSRDNALYNNNALYFSAWKLTASRKVFAIHHETLYLWTRF